MATPDLPATAAAAPVATAAGRPRLLLATFAAAIFVSAALLFMVQPMFTKMVLPRLGGAPSVWSVAIVFFQAALLAGYAYAHALTHVLPGRPSVLIHLAVMASALLALPLAIAGGWGRPPEEGEAFWLLGLFTASIGLPFFALAANAPLLQAWFARSDHPAAADPYFLYATSNVGSFLALIAYPTLLEPLVRLSGQTAAWSVGFYLLIALIAGCGALVWRSLDQVPVAATPDGSAAVAPTWKDAAFWMAAAAVPSGLLVAVTAHISIDVAAVPLLWVLPLALYLLTFVIVFSRRPPVPHWLAIEVQPVLVIAFAAVVIFDPFKSIVGLIGVHLLVFFACALVCHGELARTRPPARFLTGFYLWISAGGVIGGSAAALVAPHVFNWVAEYPILIALALLCRSGLALPTSALARYALLGAIAALLALLVLSAVQPVQLDESTFNWTMGILLAASALFWRTPLLLASLIGFVLLFNHAVLEQAGALSVRSFFGVAKVSETSDGQYRLLQHGTTLHGGQRIREADGQPAADPTELLLYYWKGSAMDQTFDAVRERIGGSIRYAVIGLGTGTLACRGEPEDTVHYYEIDPAIIHIARDSGLFSFIANCRPNTPIILGDARLTLADAPDGVYDLIVVDAFSSDAIPVHLLTREAMQVYLRKLSPHGMVVMHVSNRHLELASVVAGIAAANGAVARLNDGNDVDETAHPYKFSGTVTAVARSEDDFGPLAQSSEWRVIEPDPKQWVWTDDYSNIVGAVIRQMRDR
ncbi:MAG: fused MFS/spermidine synthase [Hyphomicrobiales bacterium]|nr:fused MFS/spermidine synthase [Hyphomicrobiales bacterium]